MTWVAPEARTFVSSGVKSACCTSVEMSTTGAFPRSFRNCTNMSWPPLPKALFTQIRAIFSALRSSSIQRTCFAMPVSWVNEVKKMLSLPFWVMMIDSEPVNCGTPAWRAMSILATVLELYTVPKIAKGLSLSTRRMTATEVGGSVWVSCTDVSSFKPRMPPFLLMSSTARLTASRHIAPTLAPPPVIAATIGSLITPWGLAGVTAIRVNSAARSGCPVRTVRMGTFSLTRCLPRNPESSRLPARVVGSVEPVADPPQEPARGCLAPEPPRDLFATRGRLHRQVALEVEGLEVVGAVADEVRQRHLRRALGHVDVLAVGEPPQEAHRDVVRHLLGRLDARGLRRRRRLVTGLRVLGEIAQHRAGRLAQKVEGSAEDAVLQLRVVGATERVAEGGGHGERCRRPPCVRGLADGAD